MQPINKFLYTNFNSPYHTFSFISSKTKQCLIKAGYLNFYEIVIRSLDEFQYTHFPGGSYGPIHRSLSVYNLYVGMSPQELSDVLRKHSRDHYNNKIIPPIRQRIREDIRQDNLRKEELIRHQEYRKTVLDILYLEFTYGSKLLEENLDSDTLYEYFDYVHEYKIYHPSNYNYLTYNSQYNCC
jgi:hypothetical protein